MEPSAKVIPTILVPSPVPVTPIYFIGDSNVLTFRNLLVDAPAFFAQPVVTTARYIPGFSAATISSDGALHERARSFLRSEANVEPVKKGSRLADDSHVAYRRQLDSRLAPPVEDEWNLVRDPVVVLMLGTLDLLAIVSELGPAVDFFCDDRYYRPEAFRGPALTALSSDLVERRLESRLAPLETGLRALRDLGAKHIYLHSLHPPTLDDEVYYRIRGAICSAKVRYKVTASINRIFRRVTSLLGVGYIDAWDATTVDGVLDARYALDGDHLNRKAAFVTLEKLVTQLIVDRARPLADHDLPILDL